MADGAGILEHAGATALEELRRVVPQGCARVSVLLCESHAALSAREGLSVDEVDYLCSQRGSVEGARVVFVICYGAPVEFLEFSKT